MHALYWVRSRLKVLVYVYIHAFDRWKGGCYNSINAFLHFLFDQKICIESIHNLYLHLFNEN